MSLDPLHPLAPVVVWAARALTYFNVMVLLWLGLTVLLNAERRRLGTWLTGGGLLLGGACSVLRAAAQAALAGEALGEPSFWWRWSWLPFAGAAFLWAVVLAWYAGRLRSLAAWRSLAGLSLLGLGTLVLLLAARPTEALTARPPLTPLAAPTGRWPLSLLTFETSAGDARLAFAVYAIFTLLCIGHGLEALLRPAAPDRFMGELAWQRARPWLVATSLAALPASLAAGLGVTGPRIVTPAAVLDLLGSGLLGVQVVLLGQAVVAYEVFTGKVLPRRGLARYWRNALILAAGFGGLLAVSLGLPLDQSYRLLLALVIVTVFYALLSWRSFVERERSLDQLRPFVASEHVVDQLTAPSATPARGDGRSGLDGPFRALVDELLGARVAYLCPLGPLAPLVGSPVAASAGASPPSPEVLAALAVRIGAERQLCLPIDPTAHGGARWVVPLWGERRPIGLLLLGERRDGGLYSQEEIEIARAAGERLIDARAAGELARRLLLLQRRRLTEEQLLDGRVRRVLHDDVLPLLHTALLTLVHHPAEPPARSVERPGDGRALSAAAEPADRSVPADAASAAATLLAEAHLQLAGLLAALPPALGPDLGRLGLIGALRRVVNDLGGAFDEVTWGVEPGGERAAAALSPLAAEVAFGAAREAIRNAARHARRPAPAPRGENGSRAPAWAMPERGAGDGGDAGAPWRSGEGADANEPRPLQLGVAVRHEDELVVEIEDDGVGLAGSADSSGSGQGLMLHATLLTIVGGSLTAAPRPGGGTRVTVRVPSGAAPSEPLPDGAALVPPRPTGQE